MSLEGSCASLSHPILYSLTEDAERWVNLPFHLHKQPPVSSIWSHALDEARLISQKIVFILQFDQFSSWVKSTQYRVL